MRELLDCKSFRLFTGTWNVAAREDDCDLGDWLCSDWVGPDGADESPDIVAVGFQEIIDLNNVVAYSFSDARSEFWIERVSDTINARRGDDIRDSYSYVAHANMAGILLTVFLKNKHAPHAKHVQTDVVPLGAMGTIGNKGGVGVRFEFHGETVCFVCSHLAAHRKNVSERNRHYGDIRSNMSFEVSDDSAIDLVGPDPFTRWAFGSSPWRMADHDFVFWIGDLNYRVDGSATYEKVMELLGGNRLDELVAKDQLNIERREGRAFCGFQEGPLTFRPTYKYQPNTDRYECRKEKTLRVPAWCDRILWMVAISSRVTQLGYWRSEINVSDHRPVMATFIVTIGHKSKI